MAQEITTYDEVSTIDKNTKLLLTKDGGLGQKSIEEVGNVINGTEDISKIGDGTVKGAIRGLNDEISQETSAMKKSDSVTTSFRARSMKCGSIKLIDFICVLDNLSANTKYPIYTNAFPSGSDGWSINGISDAGKTFSLDVNTVGVVTILPRDNITSGDAIHIHNFYY